MRKPRPATTTPANTQPATSAPDGRHRRHDGEAASLRADAGRDQTRARQARPRRNHRSRPSRNRPGRNPRRRRPSPRRAGRRERRLRGAELAAFARPADAEALRDRARAAGFSAFTESVKTDKGTLSRVRIGPVADRAAADQLKAQVQTKLGIAGIVRPQP